MVTSLLSWIERLWLGCIHFHTLDSAHRDGVGRVTMALIQSKRCSIIET